MLLSALSFQLSALIGAEIDGSPQRLKPSFIRSPNGAAGSRALSKRSSIETTVVNRDNGHQSRPY